MKRMHLVFILLFAVQNLLAASPVPEIKIGRSSLTERGELTEISLPVVLAKLHSENKLTDSAFNKKSCLNAKNIRSEGGRATRQLFLVTSTCKPNETSMFIIKEPANAHEIDALKEIAAYAPLKDLILPRHVKGLPSLALPIAYFSYRVKDRTHSIEIMPRAKGEAVSKLVAKFRDNQSPENLEKIRKMFINSNRQLSAFHKRYRKPGQKELIGKTITHQDLHYNNEYYDESTGELTFIDLETMLDSIHDPTSPWKDLVEPFALEFMPYFNDFTSLIKGIPTKTWVELSLHDSLIGYLEPYKPTERLEALKELRTMFNDFSVLPWLTWPGYGFDKDPEQSETEEDNLKENEINPVFDQLEKLYSSHHPTTIVPTRSPSR